MTIYKANKLYGLPALIIPLLLIVPILDSTVQLSDRIIGFSIFLLITLILMILPFVAKLEIGKIIHNLIYLAFLY